MRQGTRLSLIVAIFVAAVPCATASAGELRGLERELGPGASVATNEETGGVGFIGSAPGQPIEPPGEVDSGASPRAIASGFLARYGDEFGVERPGAELEVDDVLRAGDGGAAVRFGQVHDGVPVFGGEIVVNTDADGEVLSASGEAIPSPWLDTDPSVPAAQAAQTALAATAKSNGVPAAGLTASSPELSIYDSRLLGGPGLDRPTLVWRIEVTATETAPIRELVFVDAERGNVALHFNQVAHALERHVCDAGNLNAKVPCTGPDFVRSEGDPATGNGDVDAAYDFAGDTYDFFFDRFGRDSLDGNGMPVVSTVRYCEEPLDPTKCPYKNAFWNGSQMVYGEGYAAADDVVGHELGHGVTNFSSNLIYYYQSGAINESLSDVFGELVDLTNDGGSDPAADRWLIGEDLPDGALRDIDDPPAYGQPDRMTSPYYEAGKNADGSLRDAGGVHFNSGVSNKAAYLMADGGTFNGHTVAGIGLDRTALIFYEVETRLLTSASDFADLYNALPQACANLLGTGGITAADCAQVREAVEAVEMNVTPPQSPNPEAPVCPTGHARSDVFFDDLENTASGNWAHGAVTGTADVWSYPPPVGARYATSGKTNIWGDNVDTQSDSAIAMTSGVDVPTVGTPYLRFAHAYGFEDGASPTSHAFRNYDGGVVEYSTDNGASWQDAGALFRSDGNGYDGIITTTSDNPLANRPAFTAESNGYISSRLDLGSLAGETVRFRFRIATNSSGGDVGWFIDDIRIYSCRAPAPDDGGGDPGGGDPPAVDPPPELALEGGRGQDLRRVRVKVSASEDARLTARGRILVGTQSVRLSRARAQASAGETVTLTLTTSDRRYNRAKRLVRRGGTAKAKVSVTAVGRSGQRTTERLTIKPLG